MLTIFLLMVFINGKPFIIRVCLISHFIQYPLFEHWQQLQHLKFKFACGLLVLGIQYFASFSCGFQSVQLLYMRLCIYSPNHLCERSEFGFRIMIQSKLLLMCCFYIQNLQWHALDVRLVHVIWGFIWWRYGNKFCSFLIKNSAECIVICNMPV